jgi:hypothetical protein
MVDETTMPVPSPAAVAGDPGTFRRLRVLNLSAGGLHLIQGVLILILSSAFALPVMASFLGLDPVSQKLVPIPKTLFTLRIGWLVAAFFFMSALAHFLVAGPLNASYVRNLGRHINKARWVEYSFSASLMIWIISMLVGIYDIAALIPIFFVNAAMILFGWMMELHNQTTTKTNWTAFVFGCIAGIAPWIAIAIYLWSPGSKGNPPTFVYFIFVSIFIFFNTFALNQVLQYAKVGKWRDYLYGERAYIILSLVAKSLLAWQVFAGTLRP